MIYLQALTVIGMLAFIVGSTVGLAYLFIDPKGRCTCPVATRNNPYPRSNPRCPRHRRSEPEEMPSWLSR